MEDDLPFFIGGLNKDLWDDYNEKVFDWKFQKDPYNLGFISIVVIEHIPTNEPIAFNSFLPLQVRAGETIFLCLQGCDGFVDKAHRRKGLFRRSIRFLIQEMRGKAPEILIGFNLVEAAKAAQKAGSEITCDVERLKLDLGSKSKSSTGREFLMEPVGADEITRLYEKWARESQLIHFHRSRPYFEWRMSHPVREQHLYGCIVNDDIIGYIVADIVKEKKGQSLTINDYTPGFLEDYFREVVIDLKNLHPDVVSIDLIAREKSVLHEKSMNIGFSSEPLYKVIMTALNNSKQEAGSVYRGSLEVSNTENWHLTASDVY
jgi:hypothetical protein